VSDVDRVSTTNHGGAQLTIDRGDHELRVTLVGEVDLANARDVLHTVLAAEPTAFEHVLVDVGDVTYLDSAGISLLVELARRLRTARSRFEVRAPVGTAARRIIALTGLEETLDVLAEDR
jgi:anti-anti-sigma factor